MLIQELLKLSEEIVQENWAKKLAQANKDKAKKDRAEVADEAAKRKEQQAEQNVALLKKISDIVVSEVSNSIPDIDPIEMIIAKVKKISQVKNEDLIVDLINKAVKKHLQVKDYNKYFDDCLKDSGY